MLVGTGMLKAYLPDLADRVIPGCLLRDHFGVRCPTCGTGTSLMLLAEGRVQEALATSWFAPAMLLALALFDLYLLGTFIGRRRLEVQLSRRDSILLGLAGLLALGLAWVQQLWIRP